MTKTFIRFRNISRFFALPVAFLMSFQNSALVYAQAEIRVSQEAGTYAQVRSIEPSFDEGSIIPDPDPGALPNPLASLMESPLSPASIDESDMGSGASTIAVSGSIEINSGSAYTQEREVALTLSAQGGQIRGDYNLNGSVDAADYTVWRDNLGFIGPHIADGDQDGTVDQDDYQVWKTNYGKTNGITEMSFSEDGNTWSGWEVYQTTKTWTLSEGDGAKTIYVKFQDYLGNESEVFSHSITLDTQPPTVTGITGPTLTNANEVILTWQGTDTTSPIESYRWRLLQPDGALSDWRVQANGAITLSPEIAIEGIYEFQVQVQDAAGLWSAQAAHSLTIDRTAPSAVLTSPAVTNLQTYTLSYTVTDNVDSEHILTEPVDLLQGSNSINRMVTDGAGNSNMFTWEITFLPVSSISSDYDADFISFEWIETIMPTGITGDDQAKSFTLPFSFRFFDQNYSQIQISSNGFVQFGSCASCSDFSPDTIPNSSSPNAVAAPLWRDLNPSQGGTITYASSSSEFVVTWDSVPNYSNSIPQRFQLILRSDGSMVFQYASVTGGPNTAIGIENSTGTGGLRYTLTPNNGTAVRFTPPMPVIDVPTLHDGGVFSLSLDDAILNPNDPSGFEIGFMEEAGQKFFRAFEDRYDFLIFIPTLAAGERLSQVNIPGNNDNIGSFYLSGLNDTLGIGEPLYDFRSDWGASANGEFEGGVFLDSLIGEDRFSTSNFSNPDNVTFFSNALTQELAHRFGSFLTSAAGNPYGMLGRALAHWGVFFDANSSPMDGNDWVDNGDGSFTLSKSYIDQVLTQPGDAMPYNDFDLYSMGLLGQASVGSTFVIENPRLPDGRRLRMHAEGTDVEIETSPGVWEGPFYLPNDFVILGDRRDITINDITAIEGPRADQPQTDFKVGFVVVGDENESQSSMTQMVDKVTGFQDFFVNFFSDMTRGLGSLSLPSLSLASGAGSGILGAANEVFQSLYQPSTAEANDKTILTPWINSSSVKNISLIAPKQGPLIGNIRSFRFERRTPWLWRAFSSAHEKEQDLETTKRQANASHISRAKIKRQAIHQRKLR